MAKLALCFDFDEIAYRDHMNQTECQHLKEYVERWKRLGPLLEEQREEDVRRSGRASSILRFKIHRTKLYRE